jgi:SAM-dependent methyltransferase
LLIERKPIEAVEIGSGVGLLSLFASTEVKNITSLEPESAGFSAMGQFRERILSEWCEDGIPVFKNSFLDDLPHGKKFDFIYSVNVLEHVPQPENLLDEVFERLKPGGMAWFVLPHYSFPYEQHFEIPIFFNKRLTEKLFSNRIRNHKVSPDPVGLWAELSWPTQGDLRRFLLSRTWPHEFRKNVLGGYFVRLSEPHFVQRKGPLLRFLRPLIKVLKPILIALPLGLAPIIEFTISKPTGTESKLSVRRP